MKFKVTKPFIYFGEGNPRFKTSIEYTSGIDVKEEVLKEWIETGLAVILEEKVKEEVKEDIAEESEVVEEKKPRKTKKKAE